MKYLLWIALIAILYWTLRKSRNPRKDADPCAPPAQRAPERMVCCAYCGVNLPVSESVPGKDCHFCSIDHRQAAELRVNPR